MKVNDNPLNNLGYSHAPVPFYVSTAGYGILVNTSRYVTFLCGSNKLKKKESETSSGKLGLSVEELYNRKESGDYVFVDIEGAKGIEVILISGDNIRSVLQRYNLLSGGGCLPPLWGLGLKYRVKSDFNEKQTKEMANYFRNSQIPCDVIGLEPGWQTQVYPCSFLWNKERFNNPDIFVKEMHDKGFRINLWEHAYIHNTSPIYDKMFEKSCDFLGMGGLVPDFIDKDACKIFAESHKDLLDIGISGFKLDECDNSNITKGDMNWAFPDMAMFPSGIDGEKMHQIFGSLYTKVIYNLFRERNIRTYLDYRSSGLFASYLPAVLYSDIYDRKQYVEMIPNSGFSGLLWSPELRESSSESEMLRRLQLCLMSAQSVVNAWYLNMPPWLQYEVDKNNKGIRHERADFMENCVRNLVNTRMSLIPYLYSAFYDYYLHGTPPFRALVTDYSDDRYVFNINDQFLIGNNLMATPLYGDSNLRKVYFPKGEWYDFNSGKKYNGGREYTIEFSLDKLPLFVKSGTILPLAEPVQYVSNDIQFKLNFKIYGNENSRFSLFEDDGISFNYMKGEYNEYVVEYSMDSGFKYNLDSSKRYKFMSYEFVK